MAFSYHRALAPLLAVLLGLACIEAAVVHGVLVALWGWRVAAPVGAIDLVALALLVRMLRLVRRRPLRLEPDRLILRAGPFGPHSVPLEAIRGFRSDWTRAALKAPDLLNLALIAWPTIVLDLDRPIRAGRRTIRAIAHCPDDPAAFRAAVERACAARAGAA
ncbi:hypothetical protein [Sphingomonas morindae]|uniref:Uncharacterized protein n=1 Tax=Sphingomonas morindae TaxID=1541170 RepID=A0ABY4XAQ1_9SPHN|nr:hypothetical protein [Sphingomonas morindae]USI73751.1 hypothetical protein LHA26_04580 [Sphingomonas morindae]